MQNPFQKKKLDERNKEIVKLYPTLTLQEIADKYGISKQRIQKIIIKLKNENAKRNGDGK